MIPSKLIIGIESCAKYRHKQDAVRKTWLKDSDKAGIKAYFLIGRPGRPSEVLGDILYLDCGDGYLDLPAKTIAFLRFIEGNFDYDYIYKCDDDTYVNISTLLKLSIEPYDYCGYQYKNMVLKNKWHEKHLEPHLRHQTYPGTYLGPWMTGGCGYLLSKRAVQYVINEYDKFINKEFYEDKLIGDIMRTNNMPSLVLVTFKEISGFDIYYISALLKRKFSHYASFHPYSPLEMVWAYQGQRFLLLISFFLKYVSLKIGFISDLLKR